MVEAQSGERIESVVVVGAGIAGLCTALRLGGGRRRITLLERDRPPPDGGPDVAFESWRRHGVGQLRQSHAFLARLRNMPLLPETKALLERIPARHAAEMAGKPEAKRRPLPATVLSNSRWQPWAPGGLGSRFNHAKQLSGSTTPRYARHLPDPLLHRRAQRSRDREHRRMDTKDVAAIRARYADQARVVVAIGERLAKAGGL